MKFISEIGINHNGSMDMCKELILLSKVSGAGYVKIQKRNPDVCVPDHQKNKMRKTPWGEIKYIDYKKKIEFDEDQIIELCQFSKDHDIEFFASVWDVDSAKLMARHTKIGKIGSAKITDLELCRVSRELFDFLIISTGMSTEEEIKACIDVCNPDVIMHTNSTYPCPTSELNLRYIEYLKSKYPDKEIGYSGHEAGLVASFTAAALGATWIERHVTLDRSLWGSDQKSSIEPDELIQLIKGFKVIEESTQYAPGPRMQFEGELSKKKSLRG
jgi:N-acetylneuraminate synthase